MCQFPTQLCGPTNNNWCSCAPFVCFYSRAGGICIKHLLHETCSSPDCVYCVGLNRNNVVRMLRQRSPLVNADSAAILRILTFLYNRSVFHLSLTCRSMNETLHDTCLLRTARFLVASRHHSFRCDSIYTIQGMYPVSVLAYMPHVYLMMDPTQPCSVGRPAEWAATLPALQSLTVEFTVTRADPVFPADLLDIISVYNTKLTSLQCVVHSSDSSDETWTVRLGAIPLPSLVNLTLEFRGCGRIVFDLRAWEMPAVRSLRIDSASPAMTDLIISDKVLHSQLRSFEARNMTWIGEVLSHEGQVMSRLSNLVSLNLEHCFVPNFAFLDSCRLPSLQSLRIQQLPNSPQAYVSQLREIAALRLLEQLSSLALDFALTYSVSDAVWGQEHPVTVNDSFIPRRELPLLRSIRLRLCPADEGLVVMAVNRMLFRALASERLESIDVSNIELEEDGLWIRMRSLKRVVVGNMMQLSSYEFLSNLLRHADLAGRLEYLSVECCVSCSWKTAFRDLFLGTYYPLLEDLSLSLPHHAMTAEDSKCMLDNLCLPRIHNLSIACRSIDPLATFMLLDEPLSLLLVQVTLSSTEGPLPVPLRIPKAELDSLRLLKFSSTQPAALDAFANQYLVEFIKGCADKCIRLRDIIFDIPVNSVSSDQMALQNRNDRTLRDLSSGDRLSDLALVAQRSLSPKELFLVRCLPGLGEYDRFFEYRGSSSS